MWFLSSKEELGIWKGREEGKARRTKETKLNIWKIYFYLSNLSLKIVWPLFNVFKKVCIPIYCDCFSLVQQNNLHCFRQLFAMSFKYWISEIAETEKSKNTRYFYGSKQKTQSLFFLWEMVISSYLPKLDEISPLNLKYWVTNLFPQWS